VARKCYADPRTAIEELVMANSFYLVNSDVMNNCVNAVIEAFQSGKDNVVTIKNAKESRSGAQHRLRWLWFNQLEKQLAGIGKGRDKQEWNLYFKHKYVPVILLEQDEGYFDVFGHYKSTCKAITNDELRDKYKYQFWDRVISTKDMNVKSMSRWLDSVDKYVTSEYQITLITPDDLKWVRGK